MAILNTTERYGWVAALFHWATALLILFMLPLGLWMSDLPQASEGQVADKIWFYSLHKTIGMAVLILALLRIAWALFNRRPKPLHPERKVETFLAETIHWMLYAAIVLTPLTGWLYHSATSGFAPIWFADVKIPAVPNTPAVEGTFQAIHAALAFTIIAAVTLHVVGALKHLVIDRDTTIARIVPGWPVDVVDRARARLASARPHGLTAGAAALLLIFATGGFYLIEASEGEGAASAAYMPQSPAEEDATGTRQGAQQTEAESAASSDAASNGLPVWAVDHSNSAIAIRAEQSGSPVEGRFESWDAQIAFDPERLEQSRVAARIDVSSLTIGSVTDTAIGPQILDAEQYPTATFEAEGFRRTGEGGFETDGTLTMHGESQPVTVPFELSIEGDRATMSGAVDLARLRWGVGEANYPSGDTVGLTVTVDIQIEAQRAGPASGDSTSG